MERNGRDEKIAFLPENVFCRTRDDESSAMLEELFVVFKNLWKLIALGAENGMCPNAGDAGGHPEQLGA